MKQTELIKYFGDPQLCKGEKEGWFVPHPGWMAHNLVSSDLFITEKSLLINQDLEESLGAVLVASGYVRHIKEIYSFSPRRKMLSNKRGLSMHAWGLAVDINWTDNPLGAESEMNPQLIYAFQEEGWDWGGDWKSRDNHHFQPSDALIRKIVGTA